MRRILKDILTGIELLQVKGSLDIEINALVFDSRKVQPGNVFFAIRGFAVDGHNFIPQVIENGCNIIVSEESFEAKEGTTLLIVNSTSQMVNDGCSHCFMEVSSHAVHQHRVEGLYFTGGVFTNITHDHLDYHKTFSEYIRVKKAFFDGLPSGAFALTNVDDKNGSVMLQNTQASKHSFALKSPADFKAKVLENQFSGLVLSIQGTELWTRLIGDFNAYNLLAVYAVSQLLGEDSTEVMTELSKLESVEGRFQYFKSDTDITAIVDYAHTPDALENVLKTIKNIRTKNETVFTVVGCGGDRDKTKRPKMAEIACEMSDKVILTSDNPRTEDPNSILEEMMAGVPGQHFKKVLSILDREQAIKTAISMAESGDILLVAGKGHEKYQEINGVKHDFDDLKTTIELFKKLEK